MSALSGAKIRPVKSRSKKTMIGGQPSGEYRVLGYEGVSLTQSEVEAMVADGLLSVDTKVIREGEGFAAALRARPEFRHLPLSDLLAPK